MDSQKVNLYVGAIIGSLLFFLLLNFFTDLIYIGRGAHEGEPLAFAVEVEDAIDGEDAAEAIDYAALIGAADLARGKKLFGKCKACHQVADGANGVGPHLWGVVGRDIASAAGYSYSNTLTGLEGDWNLENLSAFIESPKGFAPGTKMGFGGIKKVEDRVNLIVYLNQADGSPEPLQ